MNNNNSVKRNIVLIGILNLLMEFKLYGAICILYFVSITKSIALGMSIFSITMLSAAILEIPTGALSDKIGRKKTIILGTIASLIYIILFAISKNYIVLVIGAIFEGLERALFSGNNEALIYDTLKELKKENEYDKYLGKTNSMYYFAGIISGILGAIIAYLTSYKVIMYISIIPRIINIIVAILIKEPKAEINNNNKLFEKMWNALKMTIKNKTLREQIVADSISQGMGEATFQIRSEFYKLVWPQWALGIPNALSNIGSFLGNWFSDKIIKKLGNKKTIIIGETYSIISNVIGVLTKNIISPLIMVTNSIIPTGVVKSSISQRLYEDEYRSSMASIKSFFGSIMYAIFAIIIGIVADIKGIIFTIAIAQLIKIVVIIIYVRIFKTNKELQV